MGLDPLFIKYRKKRIAEYRAVEAAQEAKGDDSIKKQSIPPNMQKKKEEKPKRKYTRKKKETRKSGPRKKSTKKVPKK